MSNRRAIDPLREGRGFHLITKNNPDKTVTVTAQGQPHLVAHGETQEIAIRNFNAMSHDKIKSQTEELQMVKR